VPVLYPSISRWYHSIFFVIICIIDMARTKQTTRKSSVGHFTTYTTFNLPLDDPAPGISKSSDEWIVGDEDDKSYKRWNEYLLPLLRAKGHRSSVCGRMIESPEKVLLLTGKPRGQIPPPEVPPANIQKVWNEYEHFAAFRKSEEYEVYYRGISVNGPPIIRQGIHMRYRREISWAVRGYVCMSVFSFNQHLSTTQKKILNNIGQRPLPPSSGYPFTPIFWLTPPEDDTSTNSGLTAFAEDPSSEQPLTAVADTLVVLDVWQKAEHEIAWRERTDFWQVHWMEMWEKIKSDFPLASYREDHYILKQIPGWMPFEPKPDHPDGNSGMVSLPSYPPKNWHVV